MGVEFQLLKTRKRTERGPSLFRVPGPINVIQGTPSFEARREEEGRRERGKWSGVNGGQRVFISDSRKTRYLCLSSLLLRQFFVQFHLSER